MINTAPFSAKIYEAHGTLCHKLYLPMSIPPEYLLNRPPSGQKCTLGCPILDGSLGGGVPCNSITEIVAESGSGKTQLCLQLALHSQLPVSHGGLAASSLYLHTEFTFPSRRLHQLSRSFCSLYDRLYSGSDYNPCDHIYVDGIHTADQLFDIMPKIESFVVNGSTQLPVRLIVIDSIAALFRSEFENNPKELKRRSSLFFKISGKLKALASRFSLAVVVTNQVVDFMGSSEGINGVRVGNLGAFYSSGRRVCAALGLAWANCVNSRLFLSRDEEIIRQEDALADCSDGHHMCRQTSRVLHVIFAPHLPDTSCEFVITRDGVFGVERRLSR